MGMSAANKKLIDKIFDDKENGIIKTAVSRASPSEENCVRLVCAVIRSGFKAVDVDYIRDGACKKHCDMLFVDYEPLLFAFNKLHYYIENKMDWPGE